MVIIQHIIGKAIKELKKKKKPSMILRIVFANSIIEGDGYFYYFIKLYS